MKPEPLNADSRKKLKRIVELLKQAHADAKLISSADDHRRIDLLGETVYEVWSQVREVEKQIDVHGFRRNKEREALSRQLPAPKPVVTIITPKRDPQMFLLPGPGRDS